MQRFSLASSTSSRSVGSPILVQRPTAPPATYELCQASAPTNVNFGAVPLQMPFVAGQCLTRVPILQPMTENSNVPSRGVVCKPTGASETFTPLQGGDATAAHCSDRALLAPAPVMCPLQPTAANVEVPRGTAVLKCASKALPPLQVHSREVRAVQDSDSALSAPPPVMSVLQLNQRAVWNAMPSDTATAKNALQVALSNWTGATPSSTSKVACRRPHQESGGAAKATDVMCYTCECGFRITSRDLLQQHMIRLHVVPFSNICNLCGNKSPSLKAQKDHIVQHVTITSIDEALNSQIPLLEKSNWSGNPAREDPPLVSSTVHLDSDEDVEASSEPPVTSDEDLSFMNLRQDLVGSVALMPFFKCVIGDCKFTSNDRQSFFSHLGAHTVKELGSLMCIYCGQRFEAIAAVVQHMVTDHGRRRFQCGWCLFRSTFLLNLQVHVHNSHPEKEMVFFKCPNISKESPSKLSAGQCVTLTHYWCSVPSCGYKHLNPDAFVWHLTSEHPRTRQYECMICHVTVGSPKDLVQHCVEHNMDIVQCVYCHHSEPSYTEMLVHLVNHHQDRRVKLALRTEGQRMLFKEFMATFQETKFRGSNAGQQPRPGYVVKSSEVAKVVNAEKLSDPNEAEMALRCEQCSERFSCVAQLRSHLYTHKKYYPYNCRKCHKHFAAVEKARTHVQTHNAKGEFHLEEHRLEPSEAEVDTFIDKQLESLEVQVAELDIGACPWRGCSHISVDIEHAVCHVRALHLPSRQMCPLCTFSSYSREVVRWHTKNVHQLWSPHPKSIAPVAKRVTTGDRKCGLCSFRATTSGAVREHWSRAHPGLAVRMVVPRRQSRIFKGATPKKRAAPLPLTDPSPFTPPSPPADASLLAKGGSRSWQKIPGGLQCKQCKHVAPSEHMLDMHTSLRHSTRPPCAKEVEKIPLLQRFMKSVSSACNKKQNRAYQPEDKNWKVPQNVKREEEQGTSRAAEQNESSSPRGENLGARVSVKKEPKLEEYTAEANEDPEPAGTRNKRPLEGKSCALVPVKREPQSADEVRDGYVCTRNGCNETFPTESELHSHMSGVHRFFAVCSNCKKAFTNKTQTLSHMEKVHPGQETAYTVIHQRGQKRTPASSEGVSTEFSWYRVKSEPLDTKNMSVVACMPDSQGYVKLDMNLFLELCDSNPSVVVKDCLKFLA